MKKENVFTAISLNDKCKEMNKPSNLLRMSEQQQQKMKKMRILKRQSLGYHAKYIKNMYNHYIVEEKTKEEFK